MVVKVVLFPEAALVFSGDRSINFSVPPYRVAMRFNSPESCGFFDALVDGEILEIGERVPNEAW